MLGLTRQTVNKELAQMIREGILVRGYANLVVKDPERLAELAWSYEPMSAAAPFALKPAPDRVHPNSY